MPNRIKQRVYDLLDACNAHDLERIATFYAPHFVGVDVAQVRPQHGPHERCKVLASYMRAFPDLQFTGDVIVEGNRAVLVWTMRGTHEDTLMHIPRTGRFVQVHGVSILTFENDKIVQGLNMWDTAGLLRSLWLLPELIA